LFFLMVEGLRRVHPCTYIHNHHDTIKPPTSASQWLGLIGLIGLMSNFRRFLFCSKSDLVTAFIISYFPPPLLKMLLVGVGTFWTVFLNKKIIIQTMCENHAITMFLSNAAWYEPQWSPQITFIVIIFFYVILGYVLWVAYGTVCTNLPHFLSHILSALPAQTFSGLSLYQSPN
jgi:hypothetical protein